MIEKRAQVKMKQMKVSNNQFFCDFEPGLICGDRRTNRRYDIELPVRFAVVGVDQIGTGTMANISSTGIAFRTASAIPVDCFIRVYISLAYSSCGTLMAYGRVVRDGEIVAVSVLRYRFERRVPEISRYIRYKAQSVAARSRKPVRSLRHFRRCREPLARSSCAPRP